MIRTRERLKRTGVGPLPSIALYNWQTDALDNLDQIEDAHRTVGGDARGRRFATQQINRAYAVLLASYFQRFCRDLHSEAVDALYQTHGPRNAAMGLLLRTALTRNRGLDRGNANEGTIGGDFNLLGMDFWRQVDHMDRQNPRRRQHLRDLNQWRNAIAHQDFRPNIFGGRPTLRLTTVRQWRSSCNRLATCFDIIIKEHLVVLTGVDPW